MKRYTIGMRRRAEPDKPLVYCNRQLKVVDQPVGCAPLTRADARKARTAMLQAARKAGEDIVVSIVELPSC